MKKTILFFIATVIITLGMTGCKDKSTSAEQQALEQKLDSLKEANKKLSEQMQAATTQTDESSPAEPTLEEGEAEPVEGAPLDDSYAASSDKIVYAGSSDGYVNIRREPTVKSDIIGKLTAGGRGALVLEEKGKWWKVRDNDVVGFVHSSQVTTDPALSQAVAKNLSKKSQKPVYYVVVGSFNSLDEAKKVKFEADVLSGSPVYRVVDKGKVLYRICPFEYKTKAEAQQTANEIKRSLYNVSAWVWESPGKAQMVYKFPGLN